ncbi:MULTISPECIES: citrate/sodium symporter CitS [unclassified Vibrio]|uniref:citrate/sodium symporter CitS n=1 Tax=unclassified Vibrio TaxID=2614977 RepID=UPI000243BAA2|nr:2-hydroxycarboxylate transporter family protein [Vibrio sp. EJY3]AEX23850.1 citrate-sodium symporter [Vibrio sp. EJY3]MEE3879134.1 2-hydroxycarboxylate transporter family protein [Vibrio sp. YYF0003]
MNEKTLIINEGQSSSLAMLSQVRIFGLPLPLYSILFMVILIAHVTDTIPDNIVGGFGFMFVVGAIFGELGNRLPIFNKYIGGAPVMIFLVAAWFVHAGLLTDKEISTVTAVMKSTDFLDLFIAVLITGSILAVNRKLLLKSLVGYIPTILAAVAGASVLGILGGLIFGISVKEIMMLYVLPIMGGGNGAGAIPLSEIYESVTGGSKEQYYSIAIAILTIANIVAIVAAAVLNGIGEKMPSLTGNGELLRKSNFSVEEQKEAKITPREIAIGLMLAACVYTFSAALSKEILPGFGDVKIHTFAYMVILVAILNACGVCSDEIKEGAKRLASFFSKQLLWVLMVGVGIAYTDLGEIINALNFTNVVIASLIVVGAIIGASVGGWVMGFYPIESSITAGLCMANRGGSGDLEVLAASNRMSLLSYAQISSRLGGGLVLIIASVVFGVLGG